MWTWPALFLLGTYHGVNPGMGWLFAVALGVQEKDRRAVWRSLAPIALGHALAIGAVVMLFGAIGAMVPLDALKIAVALTLFSLGAYRLMRHRHPRWGGMQVRFRDLTIWSFLMAWAHGAGLMVVPLLFGMSASADTGMQAMGHQHHAGAVVGAWTSILAIGVHTLGYLAVTGFIAWIVYEKLGLALLRKAWLNLDLIWALALIATGGFVLFL